MKDKTLLDKIENICKKLKDNPNPETIRIEGSKTNIVIEKNDKKEA